MIRTRENSQGTTPLQVISSSISEPIRNFHVTNEEWLQVFYPMLTQCADWWLELHRIDNDGVGSVHFARDASEIANGAPCQIMWGLQPRLARREGLVAAFVAVGCSIACSRWAAWPEKQRPRIIWEALQSCAQRPSVVTWSGSGFDAWWLLAEPLTEWRGGEELQKTIARSLNADHTQNATALFRWPQSLSSRGEGDQAPQSVRVVWWQPERRFSFDALVAAFSYTDALVPAEALQWQRFLRILPQPARMMWSALCARIPQGLGAYSLNMALASTMHLHQRDWNDFETVVSLAPWNALCKPATEELLLVWRSSRGREDTPATVHLTPSERPALDAAQSTDSALPALFLKQLPKSAWPQFALLYAGAVGATTEAADEFHYLALLTVLGTAFGRSVVVQSGRPVFSNMYTVLVGPTGDRKSTAAQLALDLLPHIAPRTLLLNGAGSQEGLMERMAGQQAGDPTLCFVDELAALLKSSRRESAGGKIEFITELFHCPDFMTHSTRSRAIRLRSPAFNILAGSTPAWLEAALQQDDILGGFANRFVFVTARPKPDNPLPSRPDTAALTELTAWIRKATQQPARDLQLSADASSAWCEFYVEWRRAIAACSEHVAALMRRVDHYILKFAAIAAAMDGTSDITKGQLTAAIDLGRFLAGCAYTLLGDVSASSDCRLEALIERKLRDLNAPMRRKQLRQSLGGRVSGEKLDRLLSGMERNGIIRQFDDGISRLVQLT